MSSCECRLLAFISGEPMTIPDSDIYSGYQLCNVEKMGFRDNCVKIRSLRLQECQNNPPQNIIFNAIERHDGEVHECDYYLCETF